MIFKFKIYIYHGEKIPKGYGFAYYGIGDWNVAYPIPFNLIIRFFRKMWYWNIMGSPTKLENMLHKAYKIGRLSMKTEIEGRDNSCDPFINGKIKNAIHLTSKDLNEQL